MFHAKTQSAAAFYEFFFAPLRLCVRTLSSLMVLKQNSEDYFSVQRSMCQCIYKYLPRRHEVELINELESGVVTLLVEQRP